MMKNPLVNAVSAAAYIALVGFLMYHGPQLIFSVGNALGVITFLLLFVLTAAMMGFLFLYQPAQLYLDGSKKEAIDLFAKTLGIFAGITVGLLAVLLFSSFRAQPVQPIEVQSGPIPQITIDASPQ